MKLRIARIPARYKKEEANEEQEILLYVLLSVGGCMGVALSWKLATRWRMTNPSADALICGAGLLVSSVVFNLRLVPFTGGH